ncbi:MAG: electron transport complex subunit RsxB, partial [Pseudomonadales bacterium]|nr:electron transport complex subunit RsxB [Pseudomonadales bacterium]
MEIILGTLTLGLLVFTGGYGLNAVAQRYQDKRDDLVPLIEALLPQTQCAQCGYPGCRPYAQAIVDGDEINKCPPGGDKTITELAELLGRPQLPLDETLNAAPIPHIVQIREADCIGCTLCIHACPVDAIVGAPQLMHSVIDNACTGCDLCLEPCPVDCIDIVPLPVTAPVPPSIPSIPQDAENRETFP